MKITKRKLRQIIKEELGDEHKQILDSLIEKIWDGYEVSQVKEIGLSYNILEQDLISEIFNNMNFVLKYGYDREIYGGNVIFFSYNHPQEGKMVFPEPYVHDFFNDEEGYESYSKEMVLDFSIEEDEYSPNIPGLYKIPISLRQNQIFKQKLKDKIFDFLRELSLT